MENFKHFVSLREKELSDFEKEKRACGGLPASSVEVCHLCQTKLS